jgi:hypothetical protein
MGAGKGAGLAAEVSSASHQQTDGQTGSISSKTGGNFYFIF